MRAETRPRRQRRIQRGLYAIEFAVVFLIFFAMLYAVICYGILFAVRMGMQNAAEEGARAGLRYQSNWAQRLVAAEGETARRLTWMKYPPTPRAQLCEMGSSLVCRDAGAATPVPQCNATTSNFCQIVVSVSYAPYSGQPWLPPLPQALLPGSGSLGAFTLNGRASMLLERGS
jgi:Flp pilus assembly protein TadG